MAELQGYSVFIVHHWLTEKLLPNADYTPVSDDTLEQRHKKTDITAKSNQCVLAYCSWSSICCKKNLSYNYTHCINAHVIQL